MLQQERSTDLYTYKPHILCQESDLYSICAGKKFRTCIELGRAKCWRNIKLTGEEMVVGEYVSEHKC